MEVKSNGFRTLVGASLGIFFHGSLVFGLPGLMSPVWGRELGISSGALSLVMFFLLAAIGIFMFFVGKWTARYGAKRLILVGTVLAAAAAAMTAIVDSVWMIYAWAFLIGAASCFVYSPGINVVQQWFPHIKGTVSGIVNMTFGIAAAIMVPLYRLWLDSYGVEFMALAAASLTLVLGLLGSQLIVLPQPVTLPQVTKADAKNGALTPAAAVRTRNFWLLWVVWALMGAAGITMVTQSVRFGLHLGFGFAAASGILASFNLTNGLSRLVSGVVSDKLGRKQTLALSFVLAGAAYFVLPHTSSLGIIMLLAAAVGFGYGTLFACSAPLIAECFGLKHFGVIFGLVFTSFGFVSGLVGPVATGMILDHTGTNYGAAFAFLGALCVVSAVFVMAVAESKVA
ncbi:MAG: MFS transporter [Peptococcaceae bacterium]|nr:MFS transporter [Peptococcaceae bacterium]